MCSILHITSLKRFVVIGSNEFNTTYYFIKKYVVIGSNDVQYYILLDWKRNVVIGSKKTGNVVIASNKKIYVVIESNQFYSALWISTRYNFNLEQALTTCQALPRVRLGTGDFLGASSDM